MAEEAATMGEHERHSNTESLHSLDAQETRVMEVTDADFLQLLHSDVHSGRDFGW